MTRRRRTPRQSPSRPGPGAPTDRVRLPSGHAQLTGPPDPERIRWISEGHPPTPAEWNYFAEWLARQPEEYVRHMLLMWDAALSVDEEMTALHEEHGEVDRATADSLGVVFARRFYAELRAGRISLCRHMRREAPRPALWVPWAPRKARCYPCHSELLKAMSGTPEDRRCDVCKTIVTELATGEGMEPSVTIQRIPMPVIVSFGVCKRCLSAAQAATHSHPEKNAHE